MGKKKDIYMELQKETKWFVEDLIYRNRLGKLVNADILVNHILNGVLLEYYMKLKNFSSNGEKGYNMQNIALENPECIAAESRKDIYAKYNRIRYKENLYIQSPYMAYYFNMFFWTNKNDTEKVKYIFYTNTPKVIAHLFWNWKKTPFSYDSNIYETQYNIVRKFSPKSSGNMAVKTKMEEEKNISFYESLSSLHRFRKIDIETFISEFSEEFSTNSLELLEEKFVRDAFFNISLFKRLLEDKNSNILSYVKLVSQLQIIPYYDLKIYIYEKILMSLKADDIEELHLSSHFIMSIFYYFYQDLLPRFQVKLSHSFENSDDQLRELEELVKESSEKFFVGYNDDKKSFNRAKFPKNGKHIFNVFYKMFDDQVKTNINEHTFSIPPHHYYPEYNIDILGTKGYFKLTQYYSYLIEKDDDIK